MFIVGSWCGKILIGVLRVRSEDALVLPIIEFLFTDSIDNYIRVYIRYKSLLLMGNLLCHQNKVNVYIEETCSLESV